MRIVIASADTDVLKGKNIPADTTVIYWQKGDHVPAADLYIDYDYEEKGSAFAAVKDRPVLVNAVIETLATLPANAIRFTGWPGFHERSLWEICGHSPFIQETEKRLQELGWDYRIVPDTPGMIAPRVIAMIINEAYFGWGEGIAETQAIDTALKLGTNYPYGPFEWAEKIGLKKIHQLLETLSKEQARYTPAPALIKALEQI